METSADTLFGDRTSLWATKWPDDEPSSTSGEVTIWIN